jgi:hypothetical protein
MHFTKGTHSIARDGKLKEAESMLRAVEKKLKIPISCPWLVNIIISILCLLTLKYGTFPHAASAGHLTRIRNLGLIQKKQLL